jgi:hypothetical protein
MGFNRAGASKRRVRPAGARRGAGLTARRLGGIGAPRPLTSVILHFYNYQIAHGRHGYEVAAVGHAQFFWYNLPFLHNRAGHVKKFVLTFADNPSKQPNSKYFFSFYRRAPCRNP